jgi:hypothetical protein
VLLALETNMPITIRVHLAEKRSTHSQYENQTIGADIEAQGLELHTPEEIHRKTRELLQIARSAIQAQLLEHVPSEPAMNGNGRPTTNGNGNGNGRPTTNGHDRHPANDNRNSNGNGRRRSYGRPDPEPTPKQKQFLRQLARERNLDAETVGEICERLVGVPLRSCTRDDLSRLIDAIVEERT